MCTFEGELENLLGEFHIKMKGTGPKKGRIFCCICTFFCWISITNFSTPLPPVSGLAGFARLCPGDQYEVSSLENRKNEILSEHTECHAVFL